MTLLYPGDRDLRIPALKRKLGLFPLTDEFTDELAARIRGIQIARGEYPTGHLSKKDLSPQ